MKKLLTLSLVCAFAVIAATNLTSCGIMKDLNEAVTYPESYTLTYEITSADGSITTATKTVDGNGNVYVKWQGEEKLYVLSDGSYTIYLKDGNGIFTASGEERLTKKAVEEATSDIKKYAEESKKQFMPTAKKDGTGEVVGRTCDVYKIGVGTENNSAFYYYYVDVQTGICLRLEVKHTALGQEVDHNTETFICTQFATENITPLF